MKGFDVGASGGVGGNAPLSRSFYLTAFWDESGGGTEGCAWAVCPLAWRCYLPGGVLPKGLSWVAYLHGACGRFTVPVFGGSSE